MSQAEGQGQVPGGSQLVGSRKKPEAKRWWVTNSEGHPEVGLCVAL